MQDKQIRNVLALLMLACVIGAAVVMLGGLIWYVAAHLDASPGDHVFSGQPTYLKNPIAMVERVFDPGQSGERRSAIMVGVVLLLFNPILRVGFAALGFLAERDWLYTAVSLVVLAVLLVSCFA